MFQERLRPVCLRDMQTFNETNSTPKYACEREREEEEGGRGREIRINKKEKKRGSGKESVGKKRVWKREKEGEDISFCVRKSPYVKRR